MLVSKMVPQVCKNVTQMGTKAPIFDPKSDKMDQEWVQNGQDGPKWPIRGLKYDFGGPGIQKDSPFQQKESPKWRPKWSKNRSKNHSKKRLFLEAGSDAIFLFFLPISTSKWCQNGPRQIPKSIQNPLLVEKTGFRSDVGKQIV